MGPKISVSINGGEYTVEISGTETDKRTFKSKDEDVIFMDGIDRADILILISSFPQNAANNKNAPTWIGAFLISGQIPRAPTLYRSYIEVRLR